MGVDPKRRFQCDLAEAASVWYLGVQVEISTSEDEHQSTAQTYQRPANYAENPCHLCSITNSVCLEGSPL